jgi:DNA-binding Lrp family transcriptional regulator
MKVLKCSLEQKRKKMRDKLLYELQKNFPLCERPFLALADKFGMSEDETIKMIQKEKKENIIRQTSAIFDTKRLGYKSSLVAFKVAEKDIDEAVLILNSHPGISHNYERNHEFNIWFTIAVPPDSLLGLENTISILAKKTKAKDFIALPTLKLFKIMVRLDTNKSAKKKENIKKRKFKDITLSKLHKDIIKYAQEDIDIKKEPFLDIIKKLDISYDTFFNTLQELSEAGVMRRFATILNHRKAGFNSNAMVVWDVDEEKAEEIGEKVASFSVVSHCYLRPKYSNWSYNLFSMIHAKSKEEIDDILSDIGSEIEYKTKKLLYSSREFKKQRVKYFTDDTVNWEKEN